jgi:hypothetical protein
MTEAATHAPRRGRRKGTGRRLCQGTRQAEEQGRQGLTEPKQGGCQHQEQEVLDHVGLKKSLADFVERGRERDEEDRDSP